MGWGGGGVLGGWGQSWAGSVVAEVVVGGTLVAGWGCCAANRIGSGEGRIMRGMERLSVGANLQVNSFWQIVDLFRLKMVVK